jgi:hypothetical protein
MRKLALIALFTMAAAAPVAAQQMWEPEVGIRAGYSRFSDDEGDTYIDFIDLPFTGGGAVVPAQGGLYGIIPLSGRFALRPTASFQNSSLGGTVTTMLATGIRFDVALSESFYLGAGPNAYLLKQNGFEDIQGAIEIAAGYRRDLAERFTMSAELFYEKREKTDFADFDHHTQGLRLGFGYGLGGTAPRRGGSTALWTPSIAVQGGWSLVSIPGNVDLTTFGFPFSGQALAGFGGSLPGPSALSAIIPMGESWAIEPSFDFHQVKPEGADALTSWQIGARANYAFNRATYVGGGLEATSLSIDGADTKVRIGPVLAAGVRFPLVGGISGRTELNFRITSEGGDDDIPSGQVTSLVFGVLLPIN